MQLFATTQAYADVTVAQGLADGIDAIPLKAWCVVLVTGALAGFVTIMARLCEDPPDIELAVLPISTVMTMSLTAGLLGFFAELTIPHIPFELMIPGIFGFGMGGMSIINKTRDWASRWLLRD